MSTDSQKKWEGEAPAEPALRPPGWHDPRKKPVHGLIVIPDVPTIALVTVCTKDRVPWLADQAVRSLLQIVWRDSTAWSVGRYVIMPDHIHLLARWGGSDVPLDRWVTYWKSQFTKRHQVADHRWQPGHWDTRMRSREHTESEWEYVSQNPVRAHLVRDVEEWPFQGVVEPWGWD
jgi:putative transposase